jgi:hypothetical protein
VKRRSRRSFPSSGNPTAGNAWPRVPLAGTGVEPLVVVVEAAEELREDELAAIVDAAGHTSRAVILRILRDA